MENDTEARLREHAKYFDGLLSLIPAKLYFSEDNSDQWQRTKQTKEQAKAARRAKLNPLNAKSAKDVFDERDSKRKREDSAAQTQDQAASKVEAKPAKKQKVAQPEPAPKQEAAAAGTVAQQVKAESQSQKERKKAKVSKEEKAKSKAEQRKKDVAKAKESNNEGTEPAGDEEVTGHFEDLDAATSPKNDTAGVDSVTSTRSPVFDAAPVQSGSSSISSFPDVAAVSSLPHSDKPSQEELKLRLAKRLQELRDARKADKEDGSPARSRQELLEDRRKKDEERKARKKELRKQQKEEEKRKLEEAQARSPLMSPSIRSPGGSHGLLPANTVPNSFAFGKVAFENGQTMTADLAKVIDPKAKTARDPKAALQKAQQHENKLSAMDPEKRADAAEKDMWLHAKKRAHGEKVKDDVSLLKKALKRKDKQKKKSEKAWDARIEGVKKGKEARQHKREENLQKRKDEKANKGSKKKGIKSKPKARAGFEGSFRAGSKRK